MFSYYGSKSKIAHLYPKPNCHKIIEPFCGSARYALRYWDKEVLLVDKWHKIVKVWEYLQEASPQDILKLPILQYKDSLDNYELCDAERWFLGFLIARGSRRPNVVAQKFNNMKADLVRISKSLYKIKHWVIKEGSYEDIVNEEATWFIDPPYFIGGEQYSIPQPDYAHLAGWCQSRKGQVIVCENTKAGWLPFVPLVNITGAFKKSTEAVFLNKPIAAVKQTELF